MGPISHGTLRISLVFAMRLAIQIGTLLLVARLLGAGGFGIFAAIASVAVVLGTLSAFGTHLMLLAETARDPHRQRSVLAYALPITLVGGSLLLALYVASVPLLLGDDAPSPGILLAIGASEILILPLLALPANQHLALGRMARSQLLVLTPLTLRLGAAAMVWTLAPEDPLRTYSLGYLIASLMALSIAAVTLPIPLPRPSEMRLPDRVELQAMGGFAALGVSGAAPNELDKALATRLLQLEEAGVYAAGARVIGAATLPVAAMLVAALPRLFRETGRGTVRPSRLKTWLIGLTLGYGLLLGAMLWAAAPLLRPVFGDQFSGVVEIVRLLCLAVPALCLRIASGNMLMAAGRAWWRVGIEFGGLILLALVATTIVQHAGARAMPIALILAEWSMALCSLALLRTFRGRTSPIGIADTTSQQL
jgi:O-antigen/teichoic acid export membrane protein